MGAGLTRIAVGDPAIADATTLRHGSDGGDVIIVGKSSGSTDLLVWDREHSSTPLSYSIVVSRGNAQVGAAALPGSTLSVGVEGQTAIVSGLSTSLADHAQTVDRAASLSASGGKPGAVIDESTVMVGRTVQVDVKVVEFSKSVLKEAGFNLFTNRGGFAFGSFSPSTLSSVTLPAAGSSGGVGFVAQTPVGQAFQPGGRSRHGDSWQSQHSRGQRSGARAWPSRVSPPCRAKAPTSCRAAKFPSRCRRVLAMSPSNTSPSALA